MSFIKDFGVRELAILGRPRPNVILMTFGVTGWPVINQISVVWRDFKVLLVFWAHVHAYYFGPC